MNIQPFRTAPQWWSPKLSPFWLKVWAPIRNILQHREQRLEHIEVRGVEPVGKALDAGQGVLIVANHSGHADAYIMYKAAHQLRTAFYFMASWQVFAMASPLKRLALRHHGCFSIDRERSDLKAFKYAVRILREEPYPLVIFPEGEVYHCNERVTPFREGTSAIAMMAAKSSKRPIVCVPAGIKYYYVQDPMPELKTLMDRLERQILWRPRPDVPLKDRIYAFAGAVLTLKEHEYLGQAQTGPLPQRIASLSDLVLKSIEERHGSVPQGSDVPERVKVLRQRVIKELESENATDEERATGERDLEDLFFVIQLFSYPGDYVAEHPSVERLAETLDKFEEDVLRAPAATIRATRRAVISFGDAVPVDPRKSKNAVRELSDTLEHGVQSLLDGISPK